MLAFTLIELLVVIAIIAILAAMLLPALAKAGVLDRVFVRLQQEQIIALKFEVVSLDSTTVKVHPDGTGALKKVARKPSGAPGAAAPPRFIWLPRMLGAP